MNRLINADKSLLIVSVVLCLLIAQGLVKGVLHLAGRGSKTAEVMFISPCVLMEEEWSNYSSDPMLLKGPAANLFFRCIRRAGFRDEDWFYTTLCKYYVPRLKPKAQDIRWNQDMLDDEINTIKPKLIICLGKIPFDHLFKTKFKLKDIQGGLFWSEKYNCTLYPMDTMMTPLLKPEFLERFMTDLKECRRALNEMQGIKVEALEAHYQTIETKAQLENLMGELQERQILGKLSYLAVDCEWAGQTAWSGQLRSFQMCWQPGHAAYLKLMNEKGEYTFDRDVREAGNIMRHVLCNPVTKFVGHNFAADAAWIEQHFLIDTYRRCAFDTMFAQQNLNEYSDLKLERLAVKYTPLGRYDIKLLMWKKESGFDEEDNDGYKTVPDKIIIPYGLADVDATMRIFPILMRQLVQQGLWDYYFNYTLPFVTDGYLELMRTGLPINRDYLDDLRTTFTRNEGVLLADFRKDIKAEANRLLLSRMVELDPQHGSDLFLEIYGLMKNDACADSPEYDQALSLFKSFVGAKAFIAELPLFDHWVEASQFNINSTAHLKRWLFDIKKFKPLKTTKKDGVQLAWERVLTLPPDRQAEYTPAADKGTLKILAGKDKLVAQVEEMKSVGNIVKAFLKGVDEKGREQGLHKWIQADERVHCNFGMAETGRPPVCSR